MLACLAQRASDHINSRALNCGPLQGESTPPVSLRKALTMAKSSVASPLLPPLPTQPPPRSSPRWSSDSAGSGGGGLGSSPLRGSNMAAAWQQRAAPSPSPSPSPSLARKGAQLQGNSAPALVGVSPSIANGNGSSSAGGLQPQAKRIASLPAAPASTPLVVPQHHQPVARGWGGLLTKAALVLIGVWLLLLNKATLTASIERWLRRQPWAMQLIRWLTRRECWFLAERRRCE